LVEPDITKTQVLTLRANKADRRTLEQAAKQRRLTLSAYLLRAGLAEAELKRDMLAA
jgi:uncharacterized protein (DUF1778 family)